jgi:hypothetical protein
VDEEELCRFLDDLRLETDALEANWRYRVVDVSFGLGLRGDEDAIRAGIHEVREWVKASRVMRTAEDVRDAIARLKLRAAEPYEVLAIHAIERDPLIADAAVVLDWVDRYKGEEPRARRQLRDPSEWNALLRPKLRQAAERVRASGHRRVLVRGFMRLPTWFTAGAYLGETAGFTVAALQDGEMWSSYHRREGFNLTTKPLRDDIIGVGRDLAVAVAVSFDPSAEIVSYLADVPTVRRYVALTTPNGPSGRAIADADMAISAALAFRDRIRTLALEEQAPRVHLFLLAPHGLALLLGHLWDRLPPTQLYEDLGSGRGYRPSFLIPN